MIIKFDINDKELYNKLSEFLKESNMSYTALDIDYNNNPYINYYLYVEDNDILGFISYDDIIDRFEIVNIYVDPKKRNMLIGSKLLEKVIEEGKNKNINNITLEVNEENVYAIKLYKKYGFIVKAKREKYYGNNDAYLMEKEMI